MAMFTSQSFESLLEEFKTLRRSTDAIDCSQTSPDTPAEVAHEPQTADCIAACTWRNQLTPLLLHVPEPCKQQLPLPSIVEHLQCAEGSLPCLAEELMAAQSSQLDELQRRKESLSQLEDTLAKEKAIFDSEEQELYSVTREICLSEGNCVGLKDDCTSLEKEIEELLAEKHQNELRLMRAVDKTQRVQEQALVYREKMSTHAARTREMESSLPIYQEVEKLKSCLQTLKEKRREYMQGDGLQLLSGEKLRLIQEQIDSALVSLAGAEEESKEKKKMIEEYKERRQQLRRDIEMKKKRRGAQLTRLQRQTSEAQSRQRQLAREAERLQLNIRDLKQKLRD